MGISFSESELQIVSQIAPGKRTPAINQYAYPVTEREAVKAFYRKEPVWCLIGTETRKFNPKIIPDNVARGDVAEVNLIDNQTQAGGPDMFGVEWVFMPEVGGSMEREDIPHLMNDANEWRDAITFPNVDSWDWAGSAAENNDAYLLPDKYNRPCIFTGFFERLISFMGFENAAVALVDEDQEDALHELLDAISDLYIDIIDHFVRYYKNIDGFLIHDDWGAQKAPFFSHDAAECFFVPVMKKITEHLHGLGLFAEIHSCGFNEEQIQHFIEAGWDAWAPQPINDCNKLFELYGDKIAISTPAVSYNKNASEQQRREAARAYVQKNCTTPGKISWFSMHDGGLLTPEYREELYIASRKAYAAWPCNC